MSRTATLFIADNCSHCDYATPRVVELFERASITLEVRKARLSELQRLKLRGFPSLFIPYASPPVMLSGRDIVDWLAKPPRGLDMPTGFGAGITVVTKSLPDAIYGALYDAYTLDALDYTPPISWAIVAGALPAGMTMSAGGVVSGTPSVVGTFTFTVEATDGVAATKQQVLTIRVVPDIGNVRRYQQEAVVERGTSVVPIEGSTGLADLRRKMERILARLSGSQIAERYMLDAADLQVRNFNAVPTQSIEDALTLLLGLINGYASGLDANGAGAPFVTVGAGNEFNIVGLGTILVTKNLGLNQLEISYTGAPLSAPFTMLPAPSGDVTGATDTAAFAALLAGAPQEWLVSPQDEASGPYYINADLGLRAGTRKFRVTGKNRTAFRIVGVGALRTWFEVTAIEHATLTNFRIGGMNTDPVTKYDNCSVNLTIAAALLDVDVQRGRFHRSRVELSQSGAALFDGVSGANQLEMIDSICSRNASAPGSYLIRTGAGAANTYITLTNNFFNLMGEVGLDLRAIHASAMLILGTNMWSGSGKPIVRSTAPATLAGKYVEAPQAVGTPGFEPQL